MSVKAKNLHEHLATCVEYGDCLLWPSATTDSGQPEARINGVTTALRRAVYLDHRGQTASALDGLIVWPNCCEQRCLSWRHLQAGTRKQWGSWRAGLGLCKHLPSTIARLTAGARGRADVVLSIELAREIRESEETNAQIAKRLGVPRERVFKIRRGTAWPERVRGSSIFTMGGA